MGTHDRNDVTKAMFINAFASINGSLEKRGYFASKTVFKVDPDGRWFFYLQVGKKFKKVEYFGREQLIRIYEIRWLRYFEVGTVPVQNEEQAEQAVQAIIGG